MDLWGLAPQPEATKWKIYFLTAFIVVLLSSINETTDGLKCGCLSLTWFICDSVSLKLKYVKAKMMIQMALLIYKLWLWFLEYLKGHVAFLLTIFSNSRSSKEIKSLNQPTPTLLRQCTVRVGGPYSIGWYMHSLHCEGFRCSPNYMTQQYITRWLS